jgi:hypothetical protein
MDAASLSVPVGGVLGKAEGRVRRMFAFSAVGGVAARTFFPIAWSVGMAEMTVRY